jgi:hypothetical protein
MLGLHITRSGWWLVVDGWCEAAGSELRSLTTNYQPPTRTS